MENNSPAREYTVVKIQNTKTAWYTSKAVLTCLNMYSKKKCYVNEKCVFIRKNKVSTVILLDSKEN